METLKDLASLSNILLPILGAVVLILLIIIFIRFIKILDNVNDTILKSHTTIDLIDESMKKVQVPLDTVVKVSNTVDKAHDLTLDAVDKAKDFAIKNADIVKEKVNRALNKESKEDIPEINPEDRIGERHGKELY